MPLINKRDILNTIIDGVKKGLDGGTTNQVPSSSVPDYSQPGNSYFRGQQPNMSYPGGYPNQNTGYPGQQGGQYGGYPAGDGYPNQPGGYPNQPGGYPGQPMGFPGQTTPYPNQPGMPYPNQTGQPYPGQPGQPSGYPSQPGQPGGYPSQPGGYGNHSGGYPSGPGGYNQPVGYPPSAPGQYGGPTQGGYQPAGAGTHQGYGNVGQISGMMNTPSIRPHPGFNAQADAEALRKAMKGIGCDKNKVITVLCARSNSQRQEISTAFKTMYGKDLKGELRSELSGDFEDLILGLMELPANFDAQHLNRAMAGLGTNESVLIEIMCSRTNAEIGVIKSAYRALYKQDLERDIIGDTSGYFQRLMVCMSAGGRDESQRTDQIKANQDAHALHRAGEQRLGTDESSFIAILASQNYAQLRLVFQEYQKITGHSIEKAIEAEFSGDIKDGLLAVVSCIQNRPAYFAKLLYNSMAGLGTRDKDLIRLVVTRSEVDLADIKREFQRLYKKSLVDMIKGDCSGAYKDGLIAIVNGN
ncbi:unnamed protein product [Enterobius vermicularis]|uniref:Annexin n=1 Tax=Enterobius vermicularis TaxID=51028 RepID=A0A0N4V646_ENTVE|nr:unnamed protein product [Enterobius vermicularis]